MLVKSRFRLGLQGFFVSMMVPVTVDFLQREYYCNMFKQEREELKKSTAVSSSRYSKRAIISFDF